MTDSPRWRDPELDPEELDEGYDDVGPGGEPDTDRQPGAEPWSEDEMGLEPRGELDPDLQAARTAAQAAGEPQALPTGELRPEEELTEYEAPEAPTPETEKGHTATDEHMDETIEERLKQENPEE